MDNCLTVHGFGNQHEQCGVSFALYTEPQVKHCATEFVRKDARGNYTSRFMRKCPDQSEEAFHNYIQAYYWHYILKGAKTRRRHKYIFITRS